MPPREPDPADGKPTDPRSTESEPVGTEPVGTEPVDEGPTDPEPTDPEPTDPEPTATDAAARAPMEWQWVVRWRQTAEPTPFAPGIALTAFATLLVAVVILTVSLGMADMPIVVIVANVVIAAGLAPALWYSWRIPVLRWLAWGTAIGLVAGWIGALAATVPRG